MIAVGERKMGEGQREGFSNTADYDLFADEIFLT